MQDMLYQNDFPRISGKEWCVLEQLVTGEKYGLELVASSGGSLKRTSIYVVLSRMEAKGLIEGREEAAPPGAMGPPRRKYKATGYGARVLHAHEIARAAMR